MQFRQRGNEVMLSFIDPNLSPVLGNETHSIRHRGRKMASEMENNSITLLGAGSKNRPRVVKWQQKMCKIMLWIWVWCPATRADIFYSTLSVSRTLIRAWLELIGFSSLVSSYKVRVRARLMILNVTACMIHNNQLEGIIRNFHPTTQCNVPHHPIFLSPRHSTVGFRKVMMRLRNRHPSSTPDHSRLCMDSRTVTWRRCC